MTFDDVCAILVTRGDVDMSFANDLPYGEVIVWDNSKRPGDSKIMGRYDAAYETKRPVVYFQDDDVRFHEHAALLDAYQPGVLVSNMYDEWIESMGYTDLALVGLGAICDNRLWETAFARFTQRYFGSDERFDERMLLDPDFIFGTLTPFNRIDFGHEILDIASDETRLWRQDGQHERKNETINMARDCRTVVCTIMTKNEEDNVRTALESTKAVFDSVLLYDTGSTDATITVVEAWCGANDKQLVVVDGKFENFRDTRNEMMRIGRTLGDYQLLMDADEEWTPCARSDFGPLWGDGYMLHYDGPLDYGQPRLIASRFPWVWTGPVHSYLDCAHPTFQAIMVNMIEPKIIHHGDERHGMSKVERDIEILEAEIERTQDDLPRNLFLLGKAHEGWDHEKAMDYYRRRIELSTGDEESYWCKYRLGCLTCEVDNDMKTGIELLWEAYQDRPQRVEALRAIGFYCTAVADATPYPEDDYLLVSRNMYRV